MHPTLPILMLPLTIASPLLPRQKHISSVFAYNKATCAYEQPPLLYNITNRTTVEPVSVQPLCDNAISTLCSLSKNPQYPLRSLKATTVSPDNNPDGACEAHLLFVPGSPGPEGFTYDSCVKAFQNITIECMLIGTGKWAREGAQAGVVGITYLEEGRDGSVDNPRFTAPRATKVNRGSPGYMVGPPGWFGNVSVEDVSDAIPGNGYRPSIPMTM